MEFLAFALVSILVCASVRSQYTNCTIDDPDRTVYYKGAWEEIGPTSLDYGGTHALSSDSNATAIFCFKGVAIYYMSPLWPYPVNSMVTLDGNRSECVNLQDLSLPVVEGGPEIVSSTPLWSATGLEDVEHELVVSMCPGGQFVVVDAFIYTLVDGNTTAAAPTSTATRSDVVGEASATPSPVYKPPPSNRPTIVAAGSAVAALLILVALLACLFCCRRRRNNRPKHVDPELKIPKDDGGGYTPVPSPFSTTTSHFSSTTGMLYPHVAINDHFYPTNADGLYDHWFMSPADIGNVFSYYRDSISEKFGVNTRPRNV